MDHHPSSKFSVMWKSSEVTKLMVFLLVEAAFPQEVTISCIFIRAEMSYILARYDMHDICPSFSTKIHMILITQCVSGRKTIYMWQYNLTPKKVLVCCQIMA